MTSEELKELKKGILLTAKYYGRELPGEVISMMADDLSDLDFSGVLNAYNHYRRNPKNKSMPLPAQIRDLLNPVVDDESLARESVEILKHAIKSIGWPEPQQARAFVGEVIWQWVERNGGWLRVCQSDLLINEGKQAQTREALKNHYKYGNKITEAIALRALPYNPQESLSESEEIDDVKMIEIDTERSKQLKTFMEAFNLNADLIKEGKP